MVIHCRYHQSFKNRLFYKIFFLGKVTKQATREFCKDWTTDGFECVKRDQCEEDGHFSSESSQVITGPRISDVNFLNKVYIWFRFLAGKTVW